MCMRRNKAKWPILLSLILVMSMLLTACSSKGGSTSTSGSGGNDQLADNQVLNIADSSDIPSLNWTQISDSTSSTYLERKPTHPDRNRRGVVPGEADPWENRLCPPVCVPERGFLSPSSQGESDSDRPSRQHPQNSIHVGKGSATGGPWQAAQGHRQKRQLDSNSPE